MFDPVADTSNQVSRLAPNVLSQTPGNELPTGLGGFRISSHYNSKRSKLMRRQFTGKATLNLHDPVDGVATVAMSDIGLLSIAYIKSTGHDVALSELQRPNLLVPVSGTLSTRNTLMKFERKDEPWLFVGRGKRETETYPGNQDHYEAFVLSMPPQVLGDRLKEVEAQGGMIWGDPSRNTDLHLARLTLALASQVALSRHPTLEKPLADAWGAVVVAQIKDCIDTCLGLAAAEYTDTATDPAIYNVRRAEEFIFERPNAIKSLRDIAVYAGVSERTLQAAFRKVRGATPMQVLAQARLQCARRALVDSEGPKTVSDVCSMCGIEHHGRFSKQYREVFGENPIVTLNSRRKR